MVKGVNKTIIEVNDTGNKYFEKIVFYVSPKYGNINSKEIAKAARDFSFEYDKKPKRKPSISLRRKMILRRKIIIISSCVLFLSGIATILALIM